MPPQQAQSVTQNDQQNNQQQTNSSSNSGENKQAEKSTGRLAHLASLLNETPLDKNDQDPDDQDPDDLDTDNQDPDDKGNDEKEAKTDGKKDGAKNDKGKGKSKGVIKSLGDLSKAVGIDKAALYDVQVTLRDQKTQVTIGQLKDAYQDSQDLEFQRIDWGDKKAKEEQELARGRAELEVLVSMIPKDKLDKDKIEAASNVVKAQLERTKADMLRRIPEWEDVEVRKSEAAEIDAHFADYGIKLANIRDAAVIHVLRNAWKSDVRIASALEKIRKQENNTPAPSGGNNKGKQTRGRATTERARNISRHFLNQLED